MSYPTKVKWPKYVKWPESDIQYNNSEVTKCHIYENTLPWLSVSVI